MFLEAIVRILVADPTVSLDERMELKAVLRHQVEALPAEQRDVVTALSIAGRSLSPWLLSRATEIPPEILYRNLRRHLPQ